jgi:preprotein translocase subunit Sec61beta
MEKKRDRVDNQGFINFFDEREIGKLLYPTSVEFRE